MPKSVAQPFLISGVVWYRAMYSQSYAWIYSQNGATTGATATIHVNPNLDVIGDVTLRERAA